MYRILLVFPLLMMLFAGTEAQQDPQYSQYMQNIMTFNPGYAGSRDAICAALLHRQQWVGLEGAPATSVFHVNAPVKPFKINSGIGLTLTQDKLGFDKDLGMNFAYAYRMNIRNGEGKLGIGVSGGFQNKSLNATWHAPGGSDPSSDPAIPKSNESATSYDLSFGLFYKTDNVYLGLSSTHISEPKLKYPSGSSPVLTRHYYLTVGYDLFLTNPAFELQPSILISSVGSSSSMDLSTIMVYNKKLWGGVSYRPGSAIIGMVGLELLNGIRIGYSYDFTTTDLRKASSGTHEFMVSYCFTIIKDKIPHKYKSVRFL